MRPTTITKDSTLRWTLLTFDANDLSVNADSLPIATVRTNGASVTPNPVVVNIGTGVYELSWNPTAEVEGQDFTILETAIIDTAIKVNTFNVKVVVAQRGTDNSPTLTNHNDQTTAITNAVTALHDFDPATDAVANVTDKTGYSLTQAFPTNFSSLTIVAGEVTTSNPASGGGSAHTAADVAALILETPVNKLLTDGDGKVTTNNPAAGGGSAHTAQDVVDLMTANIPELQQLDREIISNSRVYMLYHTNDRGFVGNVTLAVTVGRTAVIGVDFKKDLKLGQSISSVIEANIQDGEVAGITIDETGYLGSLAKIRLTGVTVGDYTLRVAVKYGGQGTQEGDIKLKVIA